MPLRTLSITIQIACDSYGCDAIQTRVEAPNLTDAMSNAKAKGWSMRCVGYKKWECPRCTRRTQRLIDAGALSKKGYILDQAKYDEVMAVVA